MLRWLETNLESLLQEVISWSVNSMGYTSYFPLLSTFNLASNYHLIGKLNISFFPLSSSTFQSGSIDNEMYLFWEEEELEFFQWRI